MSGSRGLRRGAVRRMVAAAVPAMNRPTATTSQARRARTTVGRLVALLVLGTLCLSSAGCFSSSPDKRVLQFLNTEGFGRRYVGNPEEENYVTIGDRIEWVDRTTLHPNLQGTAVVDIDGTVVIDEAGAVHVAGLTRSDVETLLTQKLAPYYLRTDIHVTIQTSTAKVYFIMGEVGQPGPKPFRGDMTVFEVLMAAGPNKRTANLSRIMVLKPDPVDPVVITVNFAHFLRTGDTTFNVPIRELDVIVVPPTLLAQLGNLIASLATPITTALSSIVQSLLLLEGDYFFYQGGRYGGGGSANYNVF